MKQIDFIGKAVKGEGRTKGDNTQMGIKKENKGNGG